MDEGWGTIPSDILEPILLRLLPTPRRRLRLVCRRWRDVIDERLPAARQARPKVLVYASDQGSGSSPPRHHPRAYVTGDVTKGYSMLVSLPAAATAARRRQCAWVQYESARMVGTSNGLICTCRGRGDDIVVFNPVTGESLAVPPPPPSSCTDEVTPCGVFCFAYHPGTGIYKILHVPRRSSGQAAFDAVHVFTLGEPKWREVPTPGSTCKFRVGLVAIDGVVYWVSKDGKWVMSFDLKDERVVLVAELPVPAQPWPWLRHLCHLVDVGGRLGFTICQEKPVTTSNIEVFVLDDGEEERVWIRSHVLLVNDDQRQQVAWPLAAHGEHLLTVTDTRGCPEKKDTVALYAHRGREHRALQCVVVPVTARSPGTKVDVYHGDHILQTFSYVETTESSLVYGCKNVHVSRRFIE